MSHFSEIKTQIKDVDALVAALIECGFTKDQIEVHKTAQHIRDYCGKVTYYTYKDTGDTRFMGGDVAHVIVRQGDMGEQHNDFGVYVDPQGDSRVFLCDFARSMGTKYCANPVAKEMGGYQAWLSKLKQEYSFAVTKKHYVAKGKKVARQQEGNKIKVYVS
jgi:hypothetical protein